MGLVESIKVQPSIYIACMVAYTYVIGINSKFKKVLALVLLLILIAGMVLSGLDSSDNNDKEIMLYSYVEEDARAFLPFGIALAKSKIPQYILSLVSIKCCEITYVESILSKII